MMQPFRKGIPAWLRTIVLLTVCDASAGFFIKGVVHMLPTVVSIMRRF